MGEVTSLQGSIALDRPVSGQDAARLARAYDACREITRRRARNFYYGLCLTPEPRRSAIFSVYAWMRRADDEADAAAHASRTTEERLARLADLRRELRDLLAGRYDQPGAPSDAAPVFIALAHTLRAYPIDPGDLRDMLDGLEEDARHTGYATRDELASYCYRVASTVGLICLSVWGLREGADATEARGLAVRRGLAFQLTNILRDFGQDFDDSPRRLYLPQADFERHGLTPEALRVWARPNECGAMIAGLARWARAEYEASATLEGLINPVCRPTLWAMTRIYSGLLAKIEAKPGRIVGAKRIRLQSAHKAGIAAVALVRARRDRWQ